MFSAISRLVAILIVCLPILGNAQGFGSFSHDQPFFGVDANCSTFYDTFESYTTDYSVAVYSGGVCWTTTYVVHPNNTPPSLWAYDTMEFYSDSASLDSLASGVDWTDAYESHIGDLGVYAQDSMESYTDLANLDGLNGNDTIERGTTFSEAYESH